MATATAEKQVARTDVKAPSIRGPRLPFHPLVEERFGIDKSSWKALVEAIFPNATSVESVILALSYCKARNLDVFKRCVHIVPIYSKEQKCMVDTIWPGIGELRTTAFRTGEYAGKDETVFGLDVSQKVGRLDITFPSWAQVTVYRMVKGQRVAFVGPKVHWLETYATVKRDDDTPNEMWATRPRGQLDKCAEAAALRTGFPEEVGNDHIPEEVQHHHSPTIEATNYETLPPSLETLTESLEAENKSGEQATVDEQFAAFQTELLAASGQEERQGVWDKYFSKGSGIAWTNEHHARADELFSSSQSSKETKSTKKQTKLLETGATAQTSGT